MGSHVSTTFQLAFGVPGGTLSALALGSAFLVLAVLGARSGATTRARRVALSSLRVLSALALFVLAAQPILWLERTRKEPGALAVVVDVSRSMGVRTAQTRMARAAERIERWLASEQGASARWLLLGDGLAPVNAQNVRAALTSKAPATELIAGVTELDQGANLGALVVVSDGADTSGLALPEHLATRVHTVLVPDARALRDDSIARVNADPVAFLHGEAKVQASIASTGLGARALTVLLKRGEQVLTQRLVEVEEGKSTDVELSFSPQDVGREAYSLSVMVDGRDDVPENNTRAFLVRVTRDRLRVLHVCGKPGWDQRFLRGFLKRDPSIDLVSFFILRSVHDLTMSAPSELALIPFPTDELFRQHLTSFDVVLLQDFDYAPYQMAPYLPLLRDYVREGGGLAMIGGALSFDGGGYGETALAEALPVRMRAASGQGAAVVPGDFAPEPVLKYLHHPLLELYPDAAQITASFRALSPLTGLNELLGAKSDAVVLLEHPHAKNAQGERLPVLTVGNFGRGRTLAFATDSSWHWSMPTAGKGGDSSAYDRFWDRAVRFLTRDPLLDPASLTTDRESYAPLAKVAIQAVARDASYHALVHQKLTVDFVTPRGARVATQSIESDEAGHASFALDAPEEPGSYRARLSADGQELASTLFLVELSGVELALPSVHKGVLEGLAQRSGGRFFPDPEHAPDLAELEVSRTTSLGTERHAPFAHPLWASLACALVMCEWWLRRRWGAR